MQYESTHSVIGFPVAIPRTPLARFRALILMTVSLMFVCGCAGNKAKSTSDPSSSGSWTGEMPAGWGPIYQQSNRYTGYIGHDIVHGGSNAVTIYANKASENEFASFSQTVYAGEFAGQRVRFSGFLKTNRVSKRTGLWLRADAQFAGVVAFDNMSKRVVRGSTGWREYSIVLDIPDNAEYIKFGALLVGTGQIWLDDCSLEVVDEDTKTTAPKMQNPGRKNKKRGPIFDSPWNMDFEENQTS